MHADQLVVLEHRNDEHGAIPASSTRATTLGSRRRNRLRPACRRFGPCLRLDARAAKRGSGGPDEMRFAPANSIMRGGASCSATTRNASPSQRYSEPNLASQMRVAFASMVSNTGSSSPGELRDDLQHLRGRGLLLQRLARSSCAAQLVEQPRVLDGDDGLGGEVL